MDEDALALKQRIIAAAIDLYLDFPEPFSVEQIVEAAGVSTEEFYSLFEDEDAPLPAFYDLCLEQYTLLRDSIDGYEAFTLEERISTFVYIMFDLFEEQKMFVKMTFEEYVGWGGAARGFRAAVADEFGTLLDGDDVPVENRFVIGRPFFYDLLAGRYFALVRFWLDDETEQQEKSVALSDKLIGFFAELATFRGIERGVDLAKYMVEVGILWVPFADAWLKPEED